jgi:DNA topoisomerase-2
MLSQESLLTAINSSTTTAKRILVKSGGVKSTTAEETEISSKYQRKTDKQHILDNPNMYIGSTEKIDSNLWIFNEQTQKMLLKQVEYIPALYKLFDEVLVNSRDHVVRMIQSTAEDKQPVSYIKVNIADVETTGGTITLTNDGDGIDIIKHTEYGIYIPELIFANLRTSTNYNKDEKRTVGGVNGIGVKLVFIWSSYAKIETVDHRRKLKYTQEFRDNLNEITTPKIVAYSGKPYTKITFRPDYARLGIPAGLTPDLIALFKKRTYDIAGITDHSVKKIKVYYNDAMLSVKNFKNYIDIYLAEQAGADTEAETEEDGEEKATVASSSSSTKHEKVKSVYEENGERWEYAVAVTPTGTFEQVSFVNGIATTKGGKHIEYILGQITRKLSALIEKKKKIVVSANTIKEQLILFVRSDIENPSFDSQTKECMNTPPAKFGSACSVTDAFIEKLSKIGIMDTLCALTDIKDNKMAKKTDGTKTKNIRGISNFIDANHAGGAKSKECILILCEGLSAMTGVVSGLSSADRDIYGIYPLRGKLLNVRGENIKKIAENKEITDLKKILGLETGRNYATIEDVHTKLRYGKIMFLVDSDTDGSHIKGLCVNVIHSEWSSLFRLSGFLSFMNTPILKASKGAITRVFYNEGEYNDWKQTDEGQQVSSSGGGGRSSKWTIKYFKGLGTSTPKEFKEYFANKKVVDFVYDEKISDDTIDKIFNKKRADERKTWLENYDKTSYLNTSLPTVKYEDFANNELIHFSVYDCQRSIPNLVDGLKTSLRKILYCAFKRNLTAEVKVAQFSGYVSENSSYHHGETSLNNAIVGMAQNFVGSNNINLLEPKGQFGSMLAGGQDSASERYIFTHLNPLTRSIFPTDDDKILRYLEDDGMLIEPEYYVPIIPFVLVNGQTGIGTGFSTSIPSYNPQQIVDYLKSKIAKEQNGDIQTETTGEIQTETTEFTPYYEGFKGIVEKMTENKYLIKGVYLKTAEDQLRITELPIGTWTMPYITFLESLMDGGVDKKGGKILPTIREFTSNSTEKVVDIRVVFPKGKLAEIEAEDGGNGIYKLLKLTTTVTTTNMHLFDKECKLRKYDTIHQIIDNFYDVRMATYIIRKAYLIGEMSKILAKLTNKARFIVGVLDDKIDLRRKDGDTINAMLTDMEFDRIDDSFDYLIRLPMNTVSKENVEKLLTEKANVEVELAELEQTPVQQIWLKELDNFEKEYRMYKVRRASGGEETDENGANGERKITAKSIKLKKAISNGGKK